MTYHIISNLITSLNLLFGFLSIIFSMRGDFILSGWLIILAIFLDIIVRKIAHLSKDVGEPSTCAQQRGEFGKEFNLLAHLASFGIAPLILIYKNFEEFYSWWIFILFFFLVCSAIRLARLNIYTKKEILLYFKGLPTAVSGGFLASTVILMRRYLIEIKLPTIGILIIILSLLMISKIRYPNFQNLKDKRLILFLIVGLILLNILGEPILWFIFSAYIVSSPFLLRAKLTKNAESAKI